MKIYEKPTAKVNKYTLIEKVADISDWITGEAAELGMKEEALDYTTSYSLAS